MQITSNSKIIEFRYKNMGSKYFLPELQTKEVIDFFEARGLTKPPIVHTFEEKNNDQNTVQINKNTRRKTRTCKVNQVGKLIMDHIKLIKRNMESYFIIYRSSDEYKKLLSSFIYEIYVSSYEINEREWLRPSTDNFSSTKLSCVYRHRNEERKTFNQLHEQFCWYLWEVEERKKKQKESKQKS